MRRPERIPIVMELFKERINKENFIQTLFPTLTELGVKETVDSWENTIEDIDKTWKENPDLRLTQVFLSVGIISNVPGMWFHTEEVNYLISVKLIAPEDILFWGQNYDKEGNLLDNTNWILLRDMSKGHIKAILSDYSNLDKKQNVSEIYLKTFLKLIL